MKIILLLLLAVTSTYFSVFSPPLKQEDLDSRNKAIKTLHSLFSPPFNYSKKPEFSLEKIKAMLETSTINPAVIEKVLTTIKCANSFHVGSNPNLTVIDYSLPSSEKRLWVFDLNERKLLFNTYVSHGINSGTLLSKFFSNKYNSKSSSIGVYKTDKTYFGRHGLSLQLAGLDAGFNDNASNRAVVMHGGWYVDEDFIKRYGRAGRSWGCPAVPSNLTNAIINTIKENSLFVVYYPSDAWFGKSKFLNCDKSAGFRSIPMAAKNLIPMTHENEQREDVLFARVTKHHEEPIVTMAVSDYERIFNNKAPLERMLRRQIHNTEYIALSNKEFEQLSSNHHIEDLNAIHFAIPVIKMVRGYYSTEMQIIDLGKIKDIRTLMALSKHANSKSYVIDFDTNTSVHLRMTNQFIRWLGL